MYIASQSAVLLQPPDPLTPPLGVEKSKGEGSAAPFLKAQIRDLGVSPPPPAEKSIHCAGNERQQKVILL